MISNELPVCILGSGEDPLSPHSNIISSELALFNKKKHEFISDEDKKLVIEILDDMNLNNENISQRLIKIGSLFMVSHPLGHKIFLEKKKEIKNAVLLNNSKIDTAFRKIIPVKQIEGSDSLCMIGENGMVVSIKFDNLTSPEISSVSCNVFN